jgi:hypothetical protein
VADGCARRRCDVPAQHLLRKTEVPDKAASQPSLGRESVSVSSRLDDD